jgi:hypothetical protein
MYYIYASLAAGAQIKFFLFVFGQFVCLEDVEEREEKR